MARGARGVTCRECGCLNFSSEHEVCNKCRSKTLTSRPTTRRLATSSGASNSQRSKDSDSRVHSMGKKRRYEETTNTSNKTNEGKSKQESERPAPAPSAVAVAAKQPDVIDLVSSDEEDENVVEQQVNRESLKTTRQGEEKQQEDEEVRVLFQSRVFPSVTFASSDFPSLEEGTLMRKKAADKGLPHSQPTGGKTAIPVGKSGQEKALTSTSQPTPPVSRSAEKTIESKLVEQRPPHIEEKKAAKTASEKKAEKVKENKATNVERKLESASTVSTVDAKQAEQKEESSGEEDPFFQSRVFDAVEFTASDFATVFDGLAVARRSHPPASSSSNAATSTSVGPATTAPTVPGGPKANEATGLAKPATTDSPTVSSTAAKTSKEALPPKASTTATTPMPTMSTASATAATPRPVAKAPAMPVAASTALPTRSSTTVVIPHTTVPSVMPPTKTPLAQSTPAVTPSTNAASTPKQTGKPATLTTSSPAPVTSTSTAKATATTTTPAATSTVASPVPVGPTAVKESSTAAPVPGQTQANGSANVLLPKKKHSEHAEEKQHSKPAAIDAKTLADADGVEFVKVNAAPREILPVEPPVLGYCSPEFLAFMRECGGDEGDEEDDPEEVSRSQLKLLDVVDLTNLSDSEDSDTESPVPTPRGDAPQKNLPVNDQVDQAAVSATVKVSATGTWYVPTLDSERKRSQPEKVMCELCEEKGLPSRLIRCPTCTKYYHKKCAKENGDENICWNCELGSMIDDSELDAEHAKHNSEYLAYLKAIRRSPSPEEDEEEGGENEEQDAAGEEDVEMATSAEAGEDNNAISDGNNAKNPGKRWMEFIGDATADIDASYHEITSRIAEELRDDEKSRLYSRGFVSREEFEAQMTEVEEYYISEEARLQQLEREKALEAKKAAEARKAQEAAEQAANDQQSASSNATEGSASSVPPPVVQDGDVSNVAAASSKVATTVAAPNGPTTASTAPAAASTAVQPTVHSHPTTHPAVPPSSFVPLGIPTTTGFSAAFRAAVARLAPAPAKP